jgi:hypothetical protein
MTLQELFSRSDRFNCVVDLTPQMAEDWLTNSIGHNRKLMDSHVDYLAGEMKAGRWRLTHQGIAFSTNGMLLDGQHRLWAVVMSGVTVPMRVFVNEPHEAMEVLDTGRRRSNDQILTLAGGLGEVTRAELAVLRAMIGGFGRREKRSPGAERDLLVRHREAIRFAMDHLFRSNRFRGVTTATTRGVIARAWYSADRDQLQHFADVLRSGVPKGEHDQPVVLLFQFLIASHEGRRSQPYEREVYAKTERALAAFLKGERLNRLYAIPKELFPLPEETKETKPSVKWN